MVLETGIFASQAIWLWRARHIRKEAKQAGKTYDEYVAENPSKKLPRSESSETVVDIEAGQSSVSRGATNEKADAESTERSDSIAAVKDTAAGLPGRQCGFKQKWRTLVLRPVPNTQV